MDKGVLSVSDLLVACTFSVIFYKFRHHVHIYHLLQLIFYLHILKHSSKVFVRGNLVVAMEASYNEVFKEKKVIVISKSTKLKIFRSESL